MPYSFDRERTPLLVMRCVGRVDDAAYAAHLREYADIVAEGRPFGVVVDARLAKPLPASQRRLQSGFLERHRQALGVLCVGEAFVVDSPLTRAALKAVLFVSPLPHPHAVAATVEEATAFIERQLATSGVGTAGQSSGG